MQATKAHGSPIKSKQKDTQKCSLAQRVMEVTTTNSASSKQHATASTSPSTATTNMSTTKKPLVSTSGSDNNSIESSLNDHEVESITNRATKTLEVSPTANQQQTERKCPTSTSSSSLLLMSSGSTNQATSNFHHHTRKHYLNEQPIIKLDTKVPYPTNNFNDEEVSYYNDTAATNNNDNNKNNNSIINLLEPKQVGGSLDNNTKPRLLAAVQQQPQHLTQQQHYQNQQQHIQQQQQQQQASLLSSSSCQHLLRNNPYINDEQQEVDHLHHHHRNNQQHQEDEEDEEDLMRYDNAQVERNLEAQRRAASMCQQSSGAINNSALTTKHHNQQYCQKQQQQLQQQQVSISTSPKAKSAPATPCNVTPTAFHQPSSQLSNMIANPSCNTLPPDIRKNISATCRVLPSSMCSEMSATMTPSSSAERKQQQVSLKYLDNLRERGERSLKEKDFARAIELFGQCISLAQQQQLLSYLKKNFMIYSQRAEAHLKLANYNDAIDDSMAARGLNPKWTQAYFLQGKAQFRIGQYADALAVFAFGLTHQEPTALSTSNLFEALIDAASSYSPDGFKAKYQKLKALNIETRPFIVVGLLGQELLATGHNEHAAIVLESALKINNLEMAMNSTNGGGDTQSTLQTNQQKKFKSSVLSTISAAYCKLCDYDKAISYMQRELDIETELEDVAAQCRVLANLGYTYFKMRKFDESLKVHRRQLNLAMKMHLFQQVSQALNALGHVHVACNNYTDALTSHEGCLVILKQLGDNQVSQVKEMLAIGHIHSQLGDLEAAERNYEEASQLLKSTSATSNKQNDELLLGSIMVNFDMAYLSLKRQAYQKAEHYYGTVLKLAKTMTKSKARYSFEMRASNGMGQACRLQRRFEEAKRWFEEQLQLAKSAQCQLGQSQALCNLGMVQQHFKNHQKAWHLFDENLKLADKNPSLKAYAHSYLGSTYYLMKRFSESKLHYDTSLNLFRELDDCDSERKTIEMNVNLVLERLNGGLNQQATEVTMLHPTTVGTTTANSTTTTNGICSNQQTANTSTTATTQPQQQKKVMMSA